VVDVAGVLHEGLVVGKGERKRDVQDKGEEDTEGAENDEVVRAGGVRSEGARVAEGGDGGLDRAVGVALVLVDHVRAEGLVGLVALRGRRVRARAAEDVLGLGGVVREHVAAVGVQAEAVARAEPRGRGERGGGVGGVEPRDGVERRGGDGRARRLYVSAMETEGWG
jgi:hypothetical protein